MVEEALQKAEEQALLSQQVVDEQELDNITDVLEPNGVPDTPEQAYDPDEDAQIE